MRKIGEPIPRSRAVRNVEEAREFVEDLGGLPVIVRAAYTLGGTGSGIARNPEDLERIVSIGLAYSRIKQVLVEESVEGWEEFEYEVMRDAADNCITICSMENVDPMGLHTGESIVVAPAQTLSDVDHQTLRAAAIRIIRALKIEGGCNIQFALHPETREYRVIEVNPRVSRSSALASKATGYPIARIAAKIAVGLTLDEIPNPVTGKTMAAFEPTIDYVVTKIPRWPFDKFPTVDARIGTSMKSTGEVMAIGRTIEESFMKALRSLEVGKVGLEPEPWSDDDLIRELRQPTDKRIYAVGEALRRGYAIEKIAALTAWNPFFIRKIANLVAMEERIRKGSLDKVSLADAKRMGFGDEYLGPLAGAIEHKVRELRPKVTYKMVDTCGGEFEARTPYYYSTYEAGDEVVPIAGKKVLIVGAGPIRIAQGVEFDYCTVAGIFALREEGVGAIIVNNNPETVSTDFDISDRLYFEPLLLEDVLNITEVERPWGVILQFGGQTSVNLAVPLQEAIDPMADGREVSIGGIQEHIEEAGVHSGDAACVLPSQTLPPKLLDSIRDITRKVCRELGVIGLVNLQLAVKGDVVYVLEANPRASRTVPYVSKAIGVPLAKVATKVMLGGTLKELGLHGEARVDHVAVKAPVFPVQKLPGVDTNLGPEMRSTGEVMGIDTTLGRAYYKAMLAAGNPLPSEGAVYITVRDEDK